MKPFNAKDYFVLFANCKLVRGISQSTICDLFLSRYKIIPNSLYEILVELSTHTICQVLSMYPDDAEGIEKYLALLAADEWGIITTNKDFFPGLEDQWDHPSVITNAVLDIDDAQHYSLPLAIRQLDALGCEAMHIRAYSPLSAGVITALYETLEGSGIHYTELLCPYDETLAAHMKALAIRMPRIQKVVFYNAPDNYQTSVISNNISFQNQFFITKPFFDEHACGLISPSLFTVNITHYMESLKYNSCLNRKVGVDRYGNIRNCPTSKMIHGNIKADNLADVITADFMKVWHITKDQVDVCNYCEYRMICTDCRALTKDPHDTNSKPAKCSYNPVTTIWEG